jgi:phosphatidylinositol alpha-1,6-mannosyltransferase
VKILVLAQVFPPRRGGSGRWLWDLYRRLPGIDVHVVTATTPDAAEFDRTANLAISRMPLDLSSWGVWDWRGGPQYAAALFRLRRIVADRRPDVIHCGKCLPEGLLAASIARWTGIPFLTFVHGEELTLAASSRELRRLTRKVLRTASRVIANSRHTRTLLMDQWQIPSEKIVVMHPGVDTTHFVPAARSAEVRRRLEWGNRRVILTVGALQKRKGQDMLIRALPAIRQRCPDVLYSIAGEGWERPSLENLVAEYGVADLVQFRGMPADAELVSCYQQCDLFALPNRQVGWDFEGFGIVLLEAQACGKAVIAGRSGGTAETMDPSNTGEIVSCDASDVLGAVAADLLQDEARRERMGTLARQWVLEQFAWDVLSRQAAEVFGISESSSLSYRTPIGR